MIAFIRAFNDWCVANYDRIDQFKKGGCCAVLRPEKYGVKWQTMRQQAIIKGYGTLVDDSNGSTCVKIYVKREVEDEQISSGN